MKINVLLRVPGIFILDQLYNFGTQSIIRDNALGVHIVRWGLNPENFAVGVQYAGYLAAFLLFALPMSVLLELYRHIIVGLLLVASHTISSYFVSCDLKRLGPATLTPILGEDSLGLLIFLVVQSTIASLCALVMNTKHLWVFGAYLLPIVTRLLGGPDTDVDSSHKVAERFVLVEISVYILIHIIALFRSALDALKWMQIIDIIYLILVLCKQFLTPIVYLIFWVSMFICNLYTKFLTKTPASSQDTWISRLLTAAADSCSSPWSLIGLCFSVSYGAHVILTLCKFYLGGLHRVTTDAASFTFICQGWDEGISLFILFLSLKTPLRFDFETHVKVAVLSFLMLIVMSKLVRNIYSLIHPILMSLGVSNNENRFRHGRVLVMCFLLFPVPFYLSYELYNYYRDLGIVVLIVISICMMTSVRTVGSVVMYLLFMLGHREKVSLASVDDIVYKIHAFCNVVEFAVGTLIPLIWAWQLMNGEYSFVDTALVVFHTYVNVWLWGKCGWNSFLLLMNASKQVKSLPEAKPNDSQDVCAICFETMMSARITPCGHFFHTACLRKWLHVRNTCPLCHSAIGKSQNDIGSNESAGATDGRVDTGMDPMANRQGTEGENNRDVVICV